MHRLALSLQVETMTEYGFDPSMASDGRGVCLVGVCVFLSSFLR